MTVPEIKKHVQTLSKKDLENYTVSNYSVAMKYLADAPDLALDRKEYLFFLLGGLAYSKGLWDESNSARCEKTVDLIRNTLYPLYTLLKRQTGESGNPVFYPNVSILMESLAKDAKFPYTVMALAFDALYKTANKEGCQAFISAFYGAAACKTPLLTGPPFRFRLQRMPHWGTAQLWSPFPGGEGGL